MKNASSSKTDADTASLTARLRHAELVAGLAMQQRNEIADLANNLQIDLTIARVRIAELEKQLGITSDIVQHSTDDTK